MKLRAAGSGLQPFLNSRWPFLCQLGLKRFDAGGNGLTALPKGGSEMDTSKSRATGEGRNSPGTAETRSVTPIGDDCFVAEVAIELSQNNAEIVPPAGTACDGLVTSDPAISKDRESKKPSVTASRHAENKNFSKQIMLAAGRPTTVKKRQGASKKAPSGFASPFPGVMPIASDVPGQPRAFPQEAIPALRLHFQSSRAEYVERRMNSHNAGVVELYCKLCLRLIVASRDEFVFPIAVKAHKCGQDLRNRPGRWGGFGL